MFGTVEKFRAMRCDANRAVQGKNKTIMRHVLTDGCWIILALEWKQSPLIIRDGWQIKLENLTA